jgi:hypothetical protein
VPSVSVRTNCERRLSALSVSVDWRWLLSRGNERRCGYVFCSPVYTKNRMLAKTGSGQI